MNVSLTPELEKFVWRKTESGFYASASEVIREALRLFIETESARTKRIKQLNEEIDVGLMQLKKGQTVSASQVFSQIQKKSQAGRRAKK